MARGLMIVWLVLLILFSSLAGCASPTTDSSSVKAPSSLPAATSSEPVLEEPLPVSTTTEQSDLPIKTPEATLEKGWTIFKDEDGGFEIGLPSTWKALTKEQLEEAMEKVTGQEQFIFYAVDVLSTAIALAEGKPQVLEFISSASIHKIPMQQEVTLNQIEEENVNDLNASQNIIKPVAHEKVELTADQAIKLKYTHNYLIGQNR